MNYSKEEKKLPFSQKLNEPNPFNLYASAKIINDRNFKDSKFFELCNNVSAAKKDSLAPDILSSGLNSFKGLL